MVSTCSSPSPFPQGGTVKFYPGDGRGNQAHEKGATLDFPVPGWGLAVWLLPLMSFHHTFHSSHVNISPFKIAAKNVLARTIPAAHPLFGSCPRTLEEAGSDGAGTQAGMKQGPGSPRVSW